MFAFAATVIYAVLALCALPPDMFVRSCLATKVLRKNKYAGYCKQNESRQFISLDRGYICSPTFAFVSRGISKTYRWNNHNHNTAKAALYNHKDDKIVSSVQESLRSNLILPHLAQYGPSTLILLLAISGGCDSVALFHSLLTLTRLEITELTPAIRYLHLDPKDAIQSNSSSGNAALSVPCELHVVHFNHEQRGENSDKDEALVKNLCAEAQVPFHRYLWSERINDNSIDATNSSTFSQDVARKWRREQMTELLTSLVTRSNCDSTPCMSGAILTAHHRDDAEETILLKLLRGSHLINLSGMADVSNGFVLNSAGTDDSIGYFAKPLLAVRKKDILDYLIKHGFEWRDDESNKENKYKRNKVRNQLIPLLSDLAGGEDAFQRRLTNLEKQSKELSQDLTQRAEEYLSSMSTDSVLLLPDNLVTFNIVQQEAMHHWAARVTDQKLLLSYSQIQRIKNQFELFPRRLQWTLDVGDRWVIRRSGKALTVFQLSNEKDGEQPTHSCSDKDTSISWKILSFKPNSSNKSYRSEESCVHELHFGNLPLFADISLMTIKHMKDVGNLTFIPPWRRGRSAAKVREFLRGQKVPLHERDESLVLCYSDSSLECALAVYLTETNRWVSNSDYEGCDIIVVLCKES